MDYKNLIDPELRKSAHRYPFNKGVVIGGNIYQTAEWRFIKAPSDIEDIKERIRFLKKGFEKGGNYGN